MKKEKKIGHKLPSASPPVAVAPPFTFAHSHRSLPWPSFSWRRQSSAVLHRVFVGPFAGDEHPPGMPSPSLPSLLCETEHASPNLSYLCSDLTQSQNFTCIMPTDFGFAKIIGHTHVLYWFRPCLPGFRLINFFFVGRRYLCCTCSIIQFFLLVACIGNLS